MNELRAVLDGQTIGTVTRTHGRLRFTYDDTWRSRFGAHPLSLSMPLVAADHPHAAIEPFLWGLLPDNELVLHNWGRRFHVSARSAFALLTEVGEDCAGAVQFLSPDRPAAADAPSIDWLTEADVAARLRALQEDASAWRAPKDTGQFSLAGAQPKTALVFDGQRWGVPSGREPTTHILKPGIVDFDGHAQNEHLCLALARALGLPTARTEVRHFEDVTAIVIERYDRVRTPHGPSFTRRVHQEDICQALAIHPSRKYQNEGGPGPADVLDLLRNNGGSQDDLWRFVDALILNWLIGGTDAHAKNYAILIGAGGAIRLAPLYDVASIFAYPGSDPRRHKLAMKIGGEYRLSAVGPGQWRQFARDVRLDADRVIDRARWMAKELPDRLSDEVNRLASAHPAVGRLSAALPRRAAELTRLLR